MNKLILSLPIILIIIIGIFLLIFILQDKDPSIPPSALIDKDIPEIVIEDLLNKDKLIKLSDLVGQNILINFFASWCAPCRVEHPLFFEIKKHNPNLYILGINHKDKEKDAINYLNIDGNPYDFIGIDNDGLIGLEFGVFGLPETFLINKYGKIIYKYLGPLTEEVIKNEIQPLL